MSSLKLDFRPLDPLDLGGKTGTAGPRNFGITEHGTAGSGNIETAGLGTIELETIGTIRLGTMEIPGLGTLRWDATV